LGLLRLYLNLAHRIEVGHFLQLPLLCLLLLQAVRNQLLLVLFHLLLEHILDEEPALGVSHVLELLELAGLVHVGMELVRIFLILYLFILELLFEPAPRFGDG